MDIENIPEELRAIPQWIVWREIGDEKVPTGVKGYAVNVTDPKTWLSFETACAALRDDKVGILAGIGFCLSPHDPYVCIDLDRVDNMETCQLQTDIYNHFISYSELSPSGEGIHIWLKGSNGKARWMKGVEIYSQNHYITVTGNVLRNASIADYTSDIISLGSTISPSNGNSDDIDNIYDEEASCLDVDICDRAYRAANGKKFLELYKGEWQQSYVSQSEAELALINILCFYSRNKNQVVRIFKSSGLYRPEKAHRISSMLKKSFDNYIPPVNIADPDEFLNATIKSKLTIENEIVEIAKVRPQDDLEWPPGFLGEIALFVYEQSPRPSPEISVGLTLAFMAGVLGRAYNVSALGLNLYVLTLADTGTGKEAAATGLSRLMGRVIKQVPQALDFIGPSQIASAQGLLRYMASGKTSFMSQIGEVGMHLQSALSQNSTVGKELKKFITTIYSKSGQDNFLNTTSYSDKEKNTPIIHAPSFSIFGESVPSRFYEALDEFMVSDGFIPRMLILEHPSERITPFNEDHASVKPSIQLVEKLQEICSQSIFINATNVAVDVPFDAETDAMQKIFRDWCDVNSRKSKELYARDLWTRTHVKALKIAAILSVCDRYDNPCITATHMKWAIRLTVRDTQNIISRFERGDTGSPVSETKQMTAIENVIKEWLMTPQPVGNGETMRKHKLIPVSHLYERLYRRNVFKDDRIGASAAIRRGLKTLEECGEVAMAPPSQIHEKYNTRQQVFKIIGRKFFE